MALRSARLSTANKETLCAVLIKRVAITTREFIG